MVGGNELRIGHARRWWIVTAMVAAFILVAAGIAVVSSPGHGRQSARSGKQSAAPAGLVRLTGAQELGLHVAQVAAMPAPGGPVTAESAVYHIFPDGSLPRPVTVQIPLGHTPAPGQQAPVLIFTKESASGRWQPLRTMIVDQGRYASVTVHRLSWFAAVQIDPGKLLQDLKDFFGELTSGALTNPAPPSCDRPSAAASDGYTYATAGSAMTACFGMAPGDGRVIKLVDDRRYPLLITTPMPEVSGGGGDIFQQAGQLLSPDGYVVYPQAEGDFNATIPDSTSTVSLFARADLAPEGQLLSSLSVGVDALSTIVGAFEGKVALSQRVEILKTLLEVESCRESTDAEQLVANCLTVHELTGSFGDMLGAILAPVVTISGLVTYFRGALNGIFDQFNNRSKFVVAVQRAPTPAQAPYQVWIDPTQAPLSEATPAYKPANVELAGDGTYELQNMTWQVWSGSQAIGTGTARIDDCNPSCAGGSWYSAPVQAIFSHPVHDCTAQYGQGTTVTGGARYWWSQVDLTYPSGLPAALSGPNQPYGLWVFSGLTSDAQQSCTG